MDLPKLYPGPTIQPRPAAAQRAAKGLVATKQPLSLVACRSISLSILRVMSWEQEACEPSSLWLCCWLLTSRRPTSTGTAGAIAGEAATASTSILITPSANTVMTSPVQMISLSASAVQAGKLWFLKTVICISKTLYNNMFRCNMPVGSQAPSAAKILRLSFHDCLK